MPYGGTTSNNDTLKFLVGDLSTSSASEYISTGKCAQLISMFGSVRAAAPHAARAIAARFADEADKRVGDLSIAASQKAKAFMDLARSLERQVATAAQPYGGGLSVSERNAARTDSDRILPQFTVGMHDSVRNPQTSYGSTST